MQYNMNIREALIVEIRYAHLNFGQPSNGSVVSGSHG